MKKILSWISRVLLMGGMALSLSSCGSKNSPAPTSPSASNSFSYSLTNYLGISGTNPMNGPSGLAVSGNNLWVANQYGFTLQAWTLGGPLLLNIAAYNSLTFAYPTGVAVGADGFVYIVDPGTNKQVAEFTPTGLYAQEFGSGTLSIYSQGLAVDPSNAYVVDYNVVHHFTYSGTGSNKSFNFAGNFGTTGAGTLAGYAYGAALDGSGNIYVGDFNNQRVVKYNPSGVFQQAITLVQGSPLGVAVDPSGNIFAVAANTDVQVYSPSGSLLTTFGKGILFAPYYIALDSNLNAYVGDDGPNLGYAESQVDVFGRN
jgi:sugar lactone lactonase YvrE